MSGGARAGEGATDAPGFEVREMTLEDLPAVFALGERVFAADSSPNLYRTWDEYELIDFFSSDTDYCLVAAAEDGRLLGFVIGQIIDKRNSAWTYGYLVWLGVEPDLEGRGVARRMVARLTDRFIEDGARIMMVDAEAENEKALRLFERLGFGQPEHHVYLTRNLTQLPEYEYFREREAAAEKGRRSVRRRRPRRAGGARGADGADNKKSGGA